MSFRTYLIQPFHTTHENEFFRAITKDLIRAFDHNDEKTVFIGNISCGGHQFDAMLISKGKIIIIDFKDYSGKVIFSENNPWKNYDSQGNLLFVAGGGGIRNPYQQLNAYRRSLMDILSNKQQEILTHNHINVKWDHINCMVLFHKNVDFQFDNMPERIKKFFTVSDSRTFLEKIKDRYSVNLELNNSELENILKILDVRPENEYDATSFIEVASQDYNKYSSKRFNSLKKLVNSNIQNQSLEIRVLNYYYALIALERLKEPEVKTFYDYKIDWKQIDDIIEINIANNSEFEAVLENNRMEHFPDNIFVGIKVKVINEEFPILQHIILSKDIIDNIIQIPVNNFDLYSQPLENKELSEDIIEELVNQICSKNSIKEKLDLIKEKLELDYNLVPSLAVGLNKETTYTAQLSSELNQLIKRNKSGGFLFKKYLLNEEIAQTDIDFRFNPFINITPLNFSQKHALNIAFRQPLSVITGPPGTGKTQLVLNIIANAIVNNKSVLFASKNNKAVDNVKDKLDQILVEKDYILRYGSKDEVREKTKSIINSYVSKIGITTFEKNDSFNKAKNELETDLKILSEIEDKLIHIEKLKTENPRLLTRLKFEESRYNNWIRSLHESKKLLFIDKNLIFEIDNSLYLLQLSKLKKINNNLLKRLWFRLFSKNEYFNFLYNGLNNFDKDIKSFLNDYNPIVTQDKSFIVSFITYIEFLIEFSKESKNVNQKNAKIKNELNTLKNEIDEKENELKSLLAIEKEIIHQKEKILSNIHFKGLNYLNSNILRKLDKSNKASISSYSFYIPDNIPWKEEDIDKFSQASNNFLRDFSAIIVTNLTIKNSFPLKKELFDLVVVDEASQCDIASSLPLVFRARQLVVIGDPLQLKHISKIDSIEEKYLQDQYNLTSLKLDYANNSLYDYCYDLSVKSKFESVLLDEHYRSHKDIIEFSNQNFYLPKLGQELKIKTVENDFIPEIRGIKWYDVRGTVNPKKNINIAEIDKCIQLIVELTTQFPQASIGLTTPFRNQAKKLFDKIPNKLKKSIVADTVHRFQGDEKDIMILSLVINDDCPISKANWINNKVPYLLNVAITRARSSLLIVGDFSYCLKLKNNCPGPLSQLANYVSSMKRVVEA